MDWDGLGKAEQQAGKKASDTLRSIDYTSEAPTQLQQHKRHATAWAIQTCMSRLLQITDPSPFTDLRRYPRPILRPPPPLRVRRLPPRSQLPLPRRLRRPRQAIARDHLPATRLQDQVPGELLRAARQPRVRVHQPHIRLLRRVQAKIQHQAVEDVYGLLQLLADCGDY